MWGQLVDPWQGHGLDPLRANDCGEEVAAMLLYKWRRLEESAYLVRTQMPSHAHDARTTSGDIARFLKSRGVLSDAVNTPTSQIRRLVHDQINAGLPGALLGNFVQPGYLHWICFRGAGDGYMGYNDPWWDQYRKAFWGWVLERYAGEAVLTSGVAG